MANAYALGVSRDKESWAKIGCFRKNFRESRVYQSYLLKHPEHELNRDELANRIAGFDYFKKTDFEDLEKKRITDFENLYKKVKVY